MKKLSQLKESHWSEMNRRSQGIVVRKEDQIQPVDLGNHCDFYFANDDFSYMGKNEFTSDEIKSLSFPNGWRLPTSEEFENAVYKDIWMDETLQDNIKIIDDIPNSITFKGLEEVRFELNGKDSVCYWCDDSGHGWPYVEVGWCPRNSADYVVIGGNYNRNGRIRLVKDK
jgi:hypothetical protein